MSTSSTPTAATTLEQGPKIVENETNPTDLSVDTSAGEHAPTSRGLAPATRAVQAGLAQDPSGAITPPIHLSSTFSWHGLEEPREFDYSRTANPTRSLLADCICDLEGGAGAVATSSGMSAVALVLQLLGPEDTLVFPHDAYGGTWRLVHAWAERGRFKVVTANLTTPEGIANALAHKPKLVWVETPSNPLLRLTDIAAICNAAQAKGSLVCVDNTLLSPGWQQPLAHGADLVLHSTTKYLNGHSDVVGGAVVAANASLAEELAWWTNCLGIGGSPFDALLATRGIRTLNARLRIHGENAAAVVDTFCSHDAVAAVNYPGLVTHPHHDLSQKQQKHPGAMVSVELHGGKAAVRAFVDAVKLFPLAVSLGGVESLMAHPATMTHAAMSDEAQKLAGITSGLVRFAIGIEDSTDLCNDIRRGLNAAEATA